MVFYFVQGLLLLLCLILTFMNYYLMTKLLLSSILFHWTSYNLDLAAIISCKYCIHLWVNKLQSSCLFIIFLLEDEQIISLGGVYQAQVSSREPAEIVCHPEDSGGLVSLTLRKWMAPMLKCVCKLYQEINLFGFRLCVWNMPRQCTYFPVRVKRDTDTFPVPLMGSLVLSFYFSCVFLFASYK
jgi:hypothetical protein